jgi:hypothetical protein
MNIYIMKLTKEEVLALQELFSATPLLELQLKLEKAHNEAEADQFLCDLIKLNRRIKLKLAELDSF